MVRFLSGPMLLVLDDEKLFLPGHTVHRWATGIAREQTRNTKRAAPLNKRTRKFPGNLPRGSLKGMISSKTERDATRILSITTVSKAPYTIFVHGGTRTTFARDKLGRFADARFPLPANNFGRFRRVQRIRGQKANPFLVRGLQATAIRHPSLRGAGSAVRRF